MKEIKQIRIEDCVECYVSTFNEEITKIKPKTFIAYKTLDGRYVDMEGKSWLNAIPCEILDNPPRPKWSDKYHKEWSIHAKVFKAISEGAVVRYTHSMVVFITNKWSDDSIINKFKICTNYTGTESDVWEEIE